MRVAALYDIHGNLPALEAVLGELPREHVDLVVVGGDVIPGPMPRECLALLQSLDVPVAYIRGNGDRVVLERVQGVDAPEVPDVFRDVIRWNAEQLTPEQVAAMARWPATFTLRHPALGDILFCHATPRSDVENFTRLTPEPRILSAFTAVDAAIVVCGHTHMPFDRAIGARRVVNAGSVGMPFGEPGAYWLLLGPGVEFRCTAYPLDAAAARIAATAYPQARHFAEHNVLHPPSAEAMLALLTGR